MHRASVVAAFALAAACGHVETPTVDAHASADAPEVADAPDDAALPPDAKPGQSKYTNSSNWSCASGSDCEDIYDFDVNASDMLTATVSGITGNSVPRLSLYKGATATGTNAFDNLTAPICGVSDMDLAAGPVQVSAAHYRLAVGRDWLKSAGSGGNYTITVTTTAASLSPEGQTSNDTASSEGHCP
jgi:hypothetical protein